MRNKFNLAIACLVLQAMLFLAVRLFPYTFISGGGVVMGITSPLVVLNLLCMAGMVPFFLSFYRNEAFIALLNQEEKQAAPHAKQNRDWPRHLLIRIGVIVGACLILLVLSLLEGGQGSAYLVAYGVAYTLGIGALLLLIEAIVLLVKRRPFKALCNIALLVVAVWVLYGMM